MNSISLYSEELLETICDEVNRYWNYHLVVRAAFPAGLQSGKRSWECHKFYPTRFEVQVVGEPSAEFDELLPEVAHWLNQCFVLRLFGIFDEYGVITMGRKEKNIYTKILAGLRHKVGAHSRGYKNSENRDAAKLAELIQKTFNEGLGPKPHKHFHLPLDKVLLPMKDGCITFVRTLEGKSIPQKGSSPPRQ